MLQSILVFIKERLLQTYSFSSNLYIEMDHIPQSGMPYTQSIVNIHK